MDPQTGQPVPVVQQYSGPSNMCRRSSTASRNMLSLRRRSRNSRKRQSRSVRLAARRLRAAAIRATHAAIRAAAATAPQAPQTRQSRPVQFAPRRARRNTPAQQSYVAAISAPRRKSRHKAGRYVAARPTAYASTHAMPAYSHAGLHARCRRQAAHHRVRPGRHLQQLRRSMPAATSTCRWSAACRRAASPPSSRQDDRRAAQARLRARAARHGRGRNLPAVLHPRRGDHARANILTSPT